jgi:hypothetical protein
MEAAGSSETLVCDNTLRYDAEYRDLTRNHSTDLFELMNSINAIVRH